MAQPIDFDYPKGPPGQQTFTAADDVARLVETLHTSGALRVANGLVAQLGDVMAILLKGLDTEAGRTGLANLLTLGKLAGHLNADGVDRFAAALERALAAAGERLDAPDDAAPGSLTVLRKLADPDVRRGLDAALALLGTLGAELHDPTPGVYSSPPPAPAQAGGKDGARA